MERGAGECTMTRAIIGARATPWRDAEAPAGRDHHRGPSGIHRLRVAVRRQCFLHRQVDDAQEKQERHPALERPFTFAVQQANAHPLNVIGCPRPSIESAIRHRQDLLFGRQRRTIPRCHEGPTRNPG